MNQRSRPYVFVAGLLAGILIISILAFNRDRATEKNDPDQNVVTNYQWQAPQIPNSLDFAGERVPLEKWDIKERLDRELLYNYYWQNNILYLLKLSNRYFPIIEERLKANGVPDDFKYLCVAESNLLPHATSSSGAVGFWQFLSGTAPNYDLELNRDVDARRDLIKSTDAACRYLKQAYQKFGTWTAAAASYNCGQAGYARRADFQGTDYYYDLLLPEETNRYLFRILAFKQILGNAKEMGFVVGKDDVYEPIPVRYVRVTKSISNLAAFAKQQGTNYKTLKLLNPWLREKSLAVKAGKSYDIAVPVK